MRLPWKSTPRPASPSPSLTPSLHYEPASKADQKTDKRLISMVEHRMKKGKPHPDQPMQPAGRRPMTGEEAAAARIFQGRYRELARESADAGVTHVFRNLEYGQTFRREGNELVANQPSLQVGEFSSIDPWRGMYPPGTRLEIHSHPDIVAPLNDMPSDLDFRAAHQQRTNALHRPGTEIRGAMMYYPPTDTFFGYTGSLDNARRAPEYHELFDPFPPTRPAPGAAPLDRLPLPDLPPELQHREKPLPAMPTAPPAGPSAAPRPASPAPSAASLWVHPGLDEGPSAAPRPSSPAPSEASLWVHAGHGEEASRPPSPAPPSAPSRASSSAEASQGHGGVTVRSASPASSRSSSLEAAADHG